MNKKLNILKYLIITLLMLFSIVPAFVGLNYFFTSKEYSIDLINQIPNDRIWVLFFCMFINASIIFVYGFIYITDKLKNYLKN